MNLSIGLLLENDQIQFPETLDNTLAKGYCFVCVPLNHKGPSTSHSNDGCIDYKNTFCDMDLSQEDWASRVVGYINQPFIRSIHKHNSNELFNEIQNMTTEFSYGNHLNLCVILVPLEGANIIPHVAGICKRQIAQPCFKSQIWMCAKVNSNNNEEKWADWETFTSLCLYNKNISLTLDLDFNSEQAHDVHFLNRWRGANISAIILPTTIFSTNSKAYPILSSQLRQFVLWILRLGARVIIRGENLHHDLRDYLLYIKHIYQNMPPLSIYENHSLPMRDVLQIPLQPLADNLESATYDIFEQDPIKYSLYKQAVYKCLCDKFSSSKNIDEYTITIMVAGCGRGPLVKVSRDACIDKGCKYQIYALDKNPNAILTLKKRAQIEWTNVTVVNEDMRTWNPPHKADIIVSELLGSFGDNELSPECLDGAQQFLKDDGVSIPSSYCSYLVPISAEKAFSEIVDYDNLYKGQSDPFQIPYVVSLSKHAILSDIKPCFEFVHPKLESTLPNEKFIQLKFPITTRHDTICHGFAGYFSCVLYDDIIQSIHPHTHSPDMFSWFPMFFPLKNPIKIKEDETITLYMWRFVDIKKIWYEWAVTTPAVSILHNSNGEHYHIDL